MATDNLRGGARLNPLGTRGGARLNAPNPRRNRAVTQYGAAGGAAAGFNRTSQMLQDIIKNNKPRSGTGYNPMPHPGLYNRQEATVPDNTQYLKTLADFMQQARDTLNSSKQTALSSAMSGIAGREAAMKQQAAASDQNIGKGYGALSAFISGQAAPIAQNYQTGIDQTAAAAADAQNAINQGNQAAVAQQQAILQRLGIGDTNVVLQNTGTANAGQTSANVADAAARAQAARTRLSENQQTAQNFNTQSGTAAALEGRGAQNKIQQQLMSYLGQLQDERTAASSAAQVTEADVVQLAQQLMDQDRQVWEGNYNRRYQVEQDAAANAQAAMEAQIEAAQAQAAPELNATTYSSLGPVGQAAYALQQSGVDPVQAKTITNALQRAYTEGRVRNVQDFVKLVQQYASGADPIDINNAASIYYQYFQ